MGRLTYVFCHGLNGCGQYDKQYAKKPYWGAKSGDVVAKLRDKGFDAYAASVSPQGSAWDRACELYAQIAGTKTDYGVAHAKEYRHKRFGRDFTGQALIPSWDGDTQLVLIGHSFGGATIRLFSELLAHGCKEEQDATQEAELSAFFAGGMGERIHSIVTLAAPTNGTSAYDLALDPAFDSKHVKTSLRYKLLDRIVSSKTKVKTDGRDRRDWADYDMRPDNAQALNTRISLLPHVYYLSVACDGTKPAQDGVRVPDLDVMEALFVQSSARLGCYSGTTQGGIVIDDAWHANDGLVNTVSARAPFEDPQKALDKDNIIKGIWNVLPDMHTHHSFFQGGFIKKENPFPFFLDLVEMIDALT